MTNNTQIPEIADLFFVAIHGAETILLNEGSIGGLLLVLLLF